MPPLPELPGVEHRHVDLSTGVRAHVACAGPADAPPLVALHGFPQHWYCWRRVIEALAGEFRILAMDTARARLVRAGAGRRLPQGADGRGRGRAARRARASSGRAWSGTTGAAGPASGPCSTRPSGSRAMSRAGSPTPGSPLRRLLRELPRFAYQPPLAAPLLGPRLIPRLAPKIVRAAWGDRATWDAAAAEVFAASYREPERARGGQPLLPLVPAREGARRVRARPPAGPHPAAGRHPGPARDRAGRGPGAPRRRRAHGVPRRLRALRAGGAAGRGGGGGPRRVRLITWNVARRFSVLPEQAAALASRAPDVVALQEVTARGHGVWLRAAAERLPHVVYSPGPRMGVAAGRPRAARARRALPVPRPESAAAGRTGGIAVHAVHVPNAANGWVKVRTLEAVRAGLAAASGPRVLCGDLNTPRRESPDGTVFLRPRLPRPAARGARDGVGRRRAGRRPAAGRAGLPGRHPHAARLRPAGALVDVPGGQGRLAARPRVRVAPS